MMLRRLIAWVLLAATLCAALPSTAQIYRPGYGAGQYRPGLYFITSGSLAPTALTPPTVAGTPDIGQTMTATPGTYSGTPTPTVTGKWQLNGVDIPGATALTFVITLTQSLPTGGVLTYFETASNGVGSPATQTSNSFTVFNPMLVATLTSMWDAEDTGKITQSGGIVSTWTSSTPDAIALTQGTAGFRPTYNATGFNGRPAVIADGVDDFLRTSGVFTPVGATPEEFWYVGSQDRPTSTAGVNFVFGQGNANGTGNTARQFGRIVASSSNRATAQINSVGSINGPSTNLFLGPSVTRTIVGATQTEVDLNNVLGTPVAVVPATTGTSISMFSSQNATPGAFYLGSVSAIMRFSSLTSNEIISVYRWSGARAGLNLP